MVASGGRLVYATCSSEPRENEDVAERFVRESPEFRAVHATATHADLPSSLVDSSGWLRTRPDLHGLEAFFGAVFRRK
jgi:16S rRNA (cytosine967-C5)-methyltransferase